jgi:hypothetical protein
MASDHRHREFGRIVVLRVTMSLCVAEFGRANSADGGIRPSEFRRWRNSAERIPPPAELLRAIDNGFHASRSGEFCVVEIQSLRTI